ncbi:hypothetical protein GCM10010430_21950 [Kitasatospora cystarginea]|uniref:Secreted protein n=1 Tax=Kitasatospora cystarginea TaxID=58350 RepID=A0ABN3DS70_9ACTN
MRAVLGAAAALRLGLAEVEADGVAVGDGDAVGDGVAVGEAVAVGDGVAVGLLAETAAEVVRPSTAPAATVMAVIFTGRMGSLPSGTTWLASHTDGRAWLPPTVGRCPAGRDRRWADRVIRQCSVPSETRGSVRWVAAAVSSARSPVATAAAGSDGTARSRTCSGSAGTWTKPPRTVDRRFFAIITDLVGTPAELLDPASDSVAWRTVPTPWGNSARPHDNTTYTPPRFPGQ